MKKIIGSVLLVVVVTAGFVGCKKIINAIFPGLDVDTPAITVTIPALQPPPPFQGAPVPPDEISVGSFTRQFNLDSIVKAKTNGSFGAGDVTSVQIKQIVFSLGDTDAQNNLSNFKSVRLTFSSNAKAEVAEIGTINFPDSTLSNYTFTPTNAPELRSYLNGTQLTYNVYGRLRRYTTKAMPMTVTVTLKVK